MKHTSPTYVRWNNRYYAYEIKPCPHMPEEMVQLSVPDLEFQISYVREDLPDLLNDLHNVLDSFREVKKKEAGKTKDNWLRIRVTTDEKQQIAARAKKHGYTSTGAFVRDTVLG